MPRTVVITGTRHGGTPQQLASLKRLLIRLAPDVLLHGGAQGVDSQAAEIAHFLVKRPKIIVHPGPVNDWDNPACYADHREPRKPFMVRNRDMVDQLGPDDVLIAVPREHSRQVHGGTWRCLDFAVKCGKTAFVISPGGVVKEDSLKKRQQPPEEE